MRKRPPLLLLEKNSYYVIRLLRPPFLILEKKILVTLLRFYGLRSYSLKKILLRYYAFTATVLAPRKKKSCYVITLLRPPFLLLEKKILVTLLRFYGHRSYSLKKILFTLLGIYGHEYEYCFIRFKLYYARITSDPRENIFSDNLITLRKIKRNSIKI